MLFRYNKYHPNNFFRSKKHDTQMTKILLNKDNLGPVKYDFYSKPIMCGFCCRRDVNMSNFLNRVNLCEGCLKNVKNIEQISEFEYCSLINFQFYWNLKDGFYESIIDYYRGEKVKSYHKTALDYYWNYRKTKLTNFNLISDLNILIFKLYLKLSF